MKLRYESILASLPRKLSDLASGQLPIGKTAPESIGKRQPIEFFHELSSRNGSFDRFRVSSEGAVLLLAAWRAEARQAASSSS